MNPFQAHLDAQDDRTNRAGRRETTRRGSAAQALAGHDSAARLLKFDAWVRQQLADRLDWTWAGDQRPRRIEQCRLHLERLVLELWRRGWMLDGKRLADHITTCLDAVGAYQRKGGVKDFWPYFKSSVDRYVGANAEDIQAEAMRAGSHVGQILGALGIKAAPAETPLPELIAQRKAEIEQAKAETLRARQTRLRAACKADADQLPLL